MTQQVERAVECSVRHRVQDGCVREKDLSRVRYGPRAAVVRRQHDWALTISQRLRRQLSHT